MNRPTLLLVPGAWHFPWHYERLIEVLPDVDVRTVTLRSVGADAEKLGTLYDDVAAVKEAASSIEGPFTVLAHSYGGAPATMALEGMDNLKRLVYLSSFPLDVGDSLESAATAGGAMPRPHWWDAHEEEGYALPKDPKDVFFHDVEPALAEESVARLGFQSWQAITQELTHAVWKTVPSTYVICDDDRALPPEVQEILAQRASRVLHLASSHSPFLSMPEKLAELIRNEMASADQ